MPCLEVEQRGCGSSGDLYFVYCTLGVGVGSFVALLWKGGEHIYSNFCKRGRSDEMTT
jgi:hypothetical protein